MSFGYAIGEAVGRGGALALFWLPIILITRAGLQNLGYYGWCWRWYNIFLFLFIVSFVIVLFAGDAHKVSFVSGVIIIIAAPSAVIFWLLSLLFKRRRER